MVPIISFFNHKGGVSKTTTVFNLGWSLAEFGLKTLIVDADPQCNLTAYCLGLDSQKEMDLFYENRKNDNVYEAIRHIVNPRTNENSGIIAVKPCDTLHKNLKLAAGNLELTDLDIYCAVGLTSDSKYNAHAMKFVGLFNAMIRETARLHEFDVVLIDMSPSSGAFNRSILMGSDYFVVPTYPEFFCSQAIEYLAKQLPSWANDFKKYRNPEITNSLPKRENPKMLGVICQKFRPHRNSNQDKVKEAQKWIDKIESASKDVLASSLKEENMVISEDLFKKSTQNKKPFNLVNIPDFNSLILISQKCNKPVFELTATEIDQSGIVLEKAQNNQEVFKQLFEELAVEIIKMTDLKPKLIASKEAFNLAIQHASIPQQ